MSRVFIFLFTLMPFWVFSQTDRDFQQKTDYVIEVNLNTVQKTLDGNIEISYTNNSTDTLKFIWIHLRPNAFKDDRTAFSEQMLQNGNTEFYFSDEDEKGYINRLNFRADGETAVLEDHPVYIDVAKLVLPRPIAPGKTVKLESPFHEKLPKLFTDLGYSDGVYFLSGWYPRPAVYDRTGWHPLPYQYGKGNYDEIGNYKVTISAPDDLTVAAAGQKIAEEKNESIKKTTFELHEATELAMVLSHNFKVATEKFSTATDGDSLSINYFITRKEKVFESLLEKSVNSSLEFWEEKLGRFPFSTIVVTDLPVKNDRIASYAGFIILPDSLPLEKVEETAFRQIGSQYLKSRVAINSRDFDFIPEGIISAFFEEFAQDEEGQKTRNSGKFFAKRLPSDTTRFVYDIALADKKDQALNAPDNIYRSATVDDYKAKLWMSRVKSEAGKNQFDNAVRKYYKDWASRHPYPKDFESYFDRQNVSLRQIFQLADHKGDVEIKQKKKPEIYPFFSLNNNSRRSPIFVSPLVGYNNYDKLMLGGIVHNYTLPVPKFHFLMAPMYGTESKRFTGLGRVGYTIGTYGKISKIDFSIAAARFDKDTFTSQDKVRNFMFVEKLVPSVALTFHDKNPLITNRLQWKTYLFKEEEIRFRYDTVESRFIDHYPKNKRYLNELTFTHRNERVLYPFDYQLTAQQAQGFAKLSIEAHQFFNYPGGGGLQARIFGGKLFELGNGDRFTSRYQLNMSGPDGEEDYTYSDYFIGRNDYSGWATHQIMMRDGGFKVRTDLLSPKVGISGDWLAAINLTTDLPKKMNPTPIHTPFFKIQAFADIGTYAEAWQKNPRTGRFLFDAGLQLNLIKDLIKIYFPVVYSEVYGDYYKFYVPKDKRFWQKISFSIDIQQFNLRRFLDISY